MDRLSDTRRRHSRPVRSAHIAGLLPLLMMAACAGTDQGPGVLTDVGAYRVGAPYQINGVEFHPVEDFAFDEVGMAGVYPPGSDGRRTANGERYSRDGLTAAHPTLQLPSLARVTSVHSGRSVVVRVNDRGAYEGNLINLSNRAAEYLGFATLGVAEVRVQVLPDESLALAELAGRDGPPPWAGTRRDPLVAWRSRVNSRQASPLADIEPQVIPESTTDRAEAPAGPLVAAVPDGLSLPAAADDPLMALTAASDDEPAFVPGPTLNLAPSPIAAVDSAAAPSAPERTAVAAQRGARSARIAAVAGARPTTSDIFATQLEATLLSPLLAAAGPAIAMSAEGRDADPSIADRMTSLAAEAVVPPQAALAEALLARRMAGDVPALADAADAVAPAHAALAEALLARRMAGDALMAADAELMAMAVVAAPPAAAPTPSTSDTDAASATNTAVARAETVAAVRDPVIRRGGEGFASGTPQPPSSGSDLPNLFAQHGQALIDDTLPPLGLSGSAPVQVIRRGPSVEIVTHLAPVQAPASGGDGLALADLSVDAAETAGGARLELPSLDGVFDAIGRVTTELAANLADSQRSVGRTGAAAASIETLVAEAVFDGIAWTSADAAVPADVEPVTPAAPLLAAAPRAPDTAMAHTAGYFVQCGAFAVSANAERMQVRLSTVGDVRFKTMTTTAGTRLTRVLVGPFASHADAEALRTDVIDSGLVSQAMIVQN